MVTRPLPARVVRASGVDCGTPYADSGECIREALRKAGALTSSAGAPPAVVLLGSGRYYVNGSHVGLTIPPNVTLKGEGVDLTAIFFAEDSNWTAPRSGYLHGSGSWGVSDLAVYVTRFHFGVVLAGGDTSWLSLRRVRIYANPFAFSVVGHTAQESHAGALLIWGLDYGKPCRCGNRIL